MKLNSWLLGLGHWLRQKNQQIHRRSVHPRCAVSRFVEKLETRQVLSFTGLGPVGVETPVNSFSPGTQVLPRVAIAPSGSYVVTWESQGQDGDSYGIYAQRFNANGVALGSEFRVNTDTTSAQFWPDIAMDSAGNFVITWASYQADFQSDIYAQRYNASGVAQGVQFRVNTYTETNQENSAVAMDASGDFVITWSSYGQDGSNYGIYAQRYQSTGAATGSEFRVNTYTTGSQDVPDVAMNPSGAFVITWESNGQSSFGREIFAQRYQSSGAVAGGEFQVNSHTVGNQRSARAAIDSAGDFVIVWEDEAEVAARQFNSAGVAQSVDFPVNTYTTQFQGVPDVSMDAAGDFAVVWHSDTQDVSGKGVYIKQFNSGRTPLTDDLKVNTYTTGNQQFAAIAANSVGDCVVAWTSVQDFNSNGIYSQRFRSTVGPVVRAVFDATSQQVINPGDVITSAVNSLNIQFSDEIATAGPGSTFDLNKYQLFRNGIDASYLFEQSFGFSNPSHVLTLTFSSPLPQGSYEFVMKQTVQDTNGRTLDGEPDRIPGGDFRIKFSVAETDAIESTFVRVNSTTVNDQANPSTAMDAAGDSVVVWNGNGPGDTNGVFGQRYNATGVRVGTEFKINTYTTSTQSSPEVAMDAAGDFVVTWTSYSQDGDNNGIFAQRFLANGTPSGGEFRVNETTAHSQIAASVAMGPSGSFVVTWEDSAQDGYANGIFARRFSSAGAPLGGEFLVNQYTTGSQFGPAIAEDGRGNFMIAWTTAGEDGSGLAVIGRMYDGSGNALSGDLIVNQYTTGTQSEPAIAANSQGDFVIAWQSDGQDGDSYGIFARHFTPQSLQLGTIDLAINASTQGPQELPAIAMDQRGDFVVSWQTAQSLGNFVEAHRFNVASGPEGSSFFSSLSTSNDAMPAVAMDSAGDFVVVWENLGRDGSGKGIYARHFRTDVAPLVSNVESTPLNAVASQNTPITSTLVVTDVDDTNLTGATIQITNNFRSDQDVLSFVNTAKITGTWDVTTGTLTLNGTDTIANYQAALRSVKYHNSTASPNTAVTRVLSIQFTDGAMASAIVNRNLSVQRLSSPSVLSGVSGTAAYVENAAAIPIAAAIVVTDADSPMLASAKVTFSNWQAEDRVQFNNIFALQHTFSQNLTNHTAVLTITGAASPDHYQTLLRSVVYSDVSDNPNTTTRVATFTVNDASVDSNAVSRNLTVTPKNDPPVLSAIELTALNYKANDPAFPPQAISATLLAGDPDSTNYTKATIQITAGYQNNSSGHDVLSFTNQSGITGSFNATTGMLTLTGTSSVSNYRTALRSVKFSSSGSAVSTATRTLTLIAFDNSSPTPLSSTPITRTVTVSTTNTPPALTGVPGTPISYARGSAAVTVASAIQVLDADSINLSGATIQITSNYQNGQDVLGFTAGFGVTGSFNAATGKLTLSGISSLANYQTLLRSVTYKTNSSSANTSARTITFIANDGLTTSSAVTRSVTLT